MVIRNIVQCEVCRGQMDVDTTAGGMFYPRLPQGWFRVTETPKAAGIEGKELHFCTETCLSKKFSRNAEPNK